MSRVSLAAVLIVLIMMPSCKPARTVGVSVAVAEAEKPAAVVELVSKPEPKPAEVSAAPAAFADDLGSKVLARALAPQISPLAIERRTRPLVRRPNLALELPELISGPALAAPIIPTMPRRAELRPWLLADRLALIDYTAEPAPPARPELPPGQRIRTPSRDVNLPINLPAQAKYQPDRASLDDPAADYSLESARAAVLPRRDKPAPFVRFDLPEPFGPKVEARLLLPEPPIVAPTPQPPK